MRPNFLSVDVEDHRVKATMFPGGGRWKGDDGLRSVQFTGGVKWCLLDTYCVPDREMGKRERTVGTGGARPAYRMGELRRLSYQVIAESGPKIRNLKLHSNTVDGVSVDLGIPSEANRTIASKECSRWERNSGRSRKHRR